MNTKIFLLMLITSTSEKITKCKNYPWQTTTKLFDNNVDTFLEVVQKGDLLSIKQRVSSIDFSTIEETHKKRIFESAVSHTSKNGNKIVGTILANENGSLSENKKEGLQKSINFCAWISLLAPINRAKLLKNPSNFAIYEPKEVLRQLNKPIQKHCNMCGKLAKKIGSR